MTHMLATVDALLPLSLLEAVRNVDTPIDQVDTEYVDELRNKRLGLSDEQIDDRFGFFMEALSYGAPPHGGMALGIDRIVMIACGESNIREVIAFPKNQMARDVMMDAPSPVPEQSLKDLGLRITEAPAQT